MNDINFRIFSVRYNHDYSISEEEKISNISLPSTSLKDLTRDKIKEFEKKLYSLCGLLFKKNIEQTNEWENVGLKILTDDFQKEIAIEYKSNFNTLRKTQHSNTAHVIFSTLEFILYTLCHHFYGAEFIIFNKKTKNGTYPQLSLRFYTSSKNTKDAANLFPPSCLSYKKIIFCNNIEKVQYISR